MRVRLKGQLETITHRPPRVTAADVGIKWDGAELTDFEWVAIKPMLPNKPRGVPPRERPPCPQWHLLGVNRFVRWRRADVWCRIMNALAIAHAKLAAVQDAERHQAQLRCFDSKALRLRSAGLRALRWQSLGSRRRKTCQGQARRWSF